MEKRTVPREAFDFKKGFVSLFSDTEIGTLNGIITVLHEDGVAD
jgi:hypothetical protein